MRKMRSAIAMLVVAFGLNIITASTACAQESSAQTTSNELAPLRIRYYDNRPQSVDQSSGFRVSFFEGLAGGGITETIADGNEYGAGSQFEFARVGLRFANLEWHNRAAFQFGVYVKQEFALYKTSQFKGDVLGFGGGAEIAILDISDAVQPWWSATIRLGLGQRHETGESRVSDYVLHFQDSGTFDWDLTFESYWQKISTGTKYRAYDNTREWDSAWLHAWQFRFYGSQQFTASRRESSIVNGVRRGQRGDVNNTSRVGLQSLIYVYRGACPTGEWAIGGMVGVEFSRAAGSKSADNGDTLTGFMFGVHGRLQLYKDLYLYLNSSLTHTSPVDRWDLSVGASIQIVKF